MCGIVVAGISNKLSTIIASRPEILAHTVETVPDLYSQVRPVAKYQQSLDILRWASEDRFEGMLTKSSIMLGLGENEEQIMDVATDLLEAGVDIFTMGQ